MSILDTPIDYAPLDPDAYRHSARLQLAQYCMRPVMVGGRKAYVDSLTTSQAGGHIEATVYLTGSSTAVPAALVTIPEELPEEVEVAQEAQ